MKMWRDFNFVKDDLQRVRQVRTIIQQSLVSEYFNKFHYKFKVLFLR